MTDTTGGLPSLLGVLVSVFLGTFTPTLLCLDWAQEILCRTLKFGGEEFEIHTTEEARADLDQPKLL